MFLDRGQGLETAVRVSSIDGKLSLQTSCILSLYWCERLHSYITAQLRKAMTPQTAPLSHELMQRTAILAESLGSYLQKDSEDFVDISDKADKVGKYDGALRSLILARLFALAGDEEAIESQLVNARRLHVDAVDLALTEITVALCLNYFSRAARLIQEFAESNPGLLNIFLQKPPTCALFHGMETFHRKAVSMNLDNVPEMREKYREIIAIMDAWGDSDQDYADALDVAGSIMRSRRLLQRGLRLMPVTTPVDGGMPYVKLAMKIDADFDTALDLTCEYSEKIARTNKKIPPSLVFEFISSEK